jgi:hypothetical protein
MSNNEVSKLTAREVIDASAAEVLETLGSDIDDVANWMNCQRESLRFRAGTIPSVKFQSLTETLIASYAEFPKDEQRMRKILKRLEQGEAPIPVFIEDNDPSNFIMEGRHRIVAFLLAELPNVPVYFVSKQEIELELSTPSP